MWLGPRLALTRQPRAAFQFVEPTTYWRVKLSKLFSSNDLADTRVVESDLLADSAQRETFSLSLSKRFASRPLGCDGFTLKLLLGSSDYLASLSLGVRRHCGSVALRHGIARSSSPAVEGTSRRTLDQKRRNFKLKAFARRRAAA